MAERGNSVVRLQVESTPYASARPNRRSALARNSANLAGRGTSSLLCMAIVGGATRRLLTSAPRHPIRFATLRQSNLVQDHDKGGAPATWTVIWSG